MVQKDRINIFVSVSAIPIEQKKTKFIWVGYYSTFINWQIKAFYN